MTPPCPPAPSLLGIIPSAESQPLRAPTPTHYSPSHWPSWERCSFLKLYLQIGLFISPRSFVTLIIKRGEGGNVASLND